VSSQGEGIQWESSRGVAGVSFQLRNTDRETRLWVDQLCEMFPDSSKYKIEIAAKRAVTLEEAALEVKKGFVKA